MKTANMVRDAHAGTKGYSLIEVVLALFYVTMILSPAVWYLTRIIRIDTSTYQAEVAARLRQRLETALADGRCSGSSGTDPAAFRIECSVVDSGGLRHYSVVARPLVNLEFPGHEEMKLSTIRRKVEAADSQKFRPAVP